MYSFDYLLALNCAYMIFTESFEAFQPTYTHTRIINLIVFLCHWETLLHSIRHSK